MILLEALGKRAEQAGAFEIAHESAHVTFDVNVLKPGQMEEGRGIALGAIVDGQLGFAASSDVIAEERLLDNALTSVQHGDLQLSQVCAGG